MFMRASVRRCNGCINAHTHTHTHTQIHTNCQVLFDAGADVMAKTPGGCTPYAFASLFKYGEDDVIHFFRREVRFYVYVCEWCLLHVCIVCIPLAQERISAVYVQCMQIYSYLYGG